VTGAAGVVGHTLAAGLTARLLARRRATLWLLCAGAVATALCALAIGPVTMSPAELVRAALGALGLTGAQPQDAQHGAVLAAIRLPRVLLGLAAGAALGVAGAALQGLFRNPLADPAVIGISGGAALAAVALIVLGTTHAAAFMDAYGPYAIPLAAFAGSLVATALVYRIGGGGAVPSVATMLLAGIAVNAFANAGIGFLTFASNDQQLRMATFWMLGSLGTATWEKLVPALLAMAPPVVALLGCARGLDAYALGEADAQHLGVDVNALKRRCVFLSALAVGAAVSVCGIIAFVGLMAPHLVRFVTGPAHRAVLPGAALAGAILMTGADVVARMAVVPAELPIGVVTSALGAPFFLWLLARRDAGARDT
jgi:iron complex transport system permease protein